ncbi:MAG: hypothetical protein MUE83_16585 [Tabrizicola sp.]|jgi:hypothetical protein|nr:hypothetical protein [Tabrizicola sp.]
MKNTLKLIVTTGIIAASTAPLFAETVIGDPMTTSCGQYLALGDADRLSMAMQYDAYNSMSEADKTAVEAMTDDEKAAMISNARAARETLTAEQKAAMTTVANDWMQKINTNCQATEEKTVVDAMDAAM